MGDDPLLYGEVEHDEDYWLEPNQDLTDIYNGDFNIRSGLSEFEVL